MPFRLPIFPLSLVLFPGTALPLHIFEPRYQRMLADCLRADRRFGITPATEAEAALEPGALGCVAEVRVNQELPDGRSNIVVAGGPRFVLSRLLSEPHPYLVGLVQTFEDDPATNPAREDTEALRDLFVHYLAGLRELHDAMPEEPELPENGADLSFHVAGSIECDLGIKRQLLAERSTIRRVKALMLLLPVLASAVESGLKVHRRAHSNGKAGTLPDVLAQ
jgi:Lon protease-like protein